MLESLAVCGVWRDARSRSFGMNQVCTSLMELTLTEAESGEKMPGTRTVAGQSRGSHLRCRGSRL